MRTASDRKEDTGPEALAIHYPKGYIDRLSESGLLFSRAKRSL